MQYRLYSITHLTELHNYSAYTVKKARQLRRELAVQQSKYSPIGLGVEHAKASGKGVSYRMGEPDVRRDIWKAIEKEKK